MNNYQPSKVCQLFLYSERSEEACGFIMMFIFFILYKKFLLEEVL